MRGFWVGHPELGGILVMAEDRNTARMVGSNELGIDYVCLNARCVPALDAKFGAGIVDWDDAIKCGAVIVCSHCGWSLAKVLNMPAECPRCGVQLIDNKHGTGK